MVEPSPIVFSNSGNHRRIHIHRSLGIVGRGLPQAIFAVAQVVVHVAKGDQSHLLMALLGNADRLAQVRIAKIATERLPIAPANRLRLIPQPIGAVMSQKNEGGLSGAGRRLGNSIGRIHHARHGKAIAVKLPIAPVRAAPAKGSPPNHTQPQFRPIQATVAHMGRPQQIQLRLHPIFAAAIVGTFFAAPRSGAIPGIMVAQNHRFGQRQRRDRPGNFHRFVAKITHKQRRINA